MEKKITDMFRMILELIAVMRFDLCLNFGTINDLWPKEEL